MIYKTKYSMTYFDKIAEYLELVKKQLSLFKSNEFSHLCLTKEFQEITLELLESRTPKKPIRSTMIALAYFDKEVKFYKCPTCNTTTIYGANYCNQCGQRVDWSEIY